MRIKYIGNYIEHLKNDSFVDYCYFDVDAIKNNSSVFKYLNNKDRDILLLIFASKKKQKAVQRIMSRSQPSLVYDIKRIKERVEFIAYLRKVYDVFRDFLLYRSCEYSDFTINVLILMYYTSSYTHSANVLNCPQIYVRNVFEKSLKQMCKLKHWDIYEIFSLISNNKNVIKRVYKK